jgi:hypothetical protein
MRKALASERRNPGLDPNSFIENYWNRIHHINQSIWPRHLGFMNIRNVFVFLVFIGTFDLTALPVNRRAEGRRRLSCLARS